MLLHDIAKIHEFIWERNRDQSDERRLLSHAVIGVQMVEVALEQLTDFPEELSLRMRHLEGLYA